MPAKKPPAPVVNDPDYLKALEDLAKILKDEISAASLAGSGTVAQLAAQYRGTLTEIAAIKTAAVAPVAAAAKPRTVRDDLKDRRENRSAAPAPVPAAKSQGRQRRA
jgi:hypothetical protein